MVGTKTTIKILKKLKKYLDNEVEPRKQELSLQVVSYSLHILQVVS